MSKGNKTCNINAVVPILFGFEQIYVQVLYSAHHKIDFKSDYFCQNEGGKCFQIQSSAWNNLFPSDFHLRRYFPDDLVHDDSQQDAPEEKENIS